MGNRVGSATQPESVADEHCASVRSPTAQGGAPGMRKIRAENGAASARALPGEKTELCEAAFA